MATKLEVEKIDFAFQPIVNTYTGKIFAVEALIRETTKLNFETIDNFFSYYKKEKKLVDIDLQLLKKTVKKYNNISIENVSLFYNLDVNIIKEKNFDIKDYTDIINNNSTRTGTVYFDITEQNNLKDNKLVDDLMQILDEHNYNIVIDNFGSKTTNLHYLYSDKPSYIKIDRHFIDNIKNDSKKRIFCSSIIDLAHTMNKKVIASGVETVEEYYTCKELKFDFIQGYLVAKPSTNLNKIEKRYSHIKDLSLSDKRGLYANLIDKSYIDKIEPLDVNTTLHELFIYFKRNRFNTFVPIIDQNKKILGAIYEVDIKGISYSQYGLSLAQNSSYKSKLRSFIEPVIQIDITWGIDKALELFNMQSDSKGIFVTKNDRYYGFINLNNLLSLSYKRNLEIAENKNPLTKLPGNNQIEKFIDNIFESNMESHIVYFDFNDFKPFNDKYGFRQGDRAILMFSEILQKVIAKDGFIAHIGGDDFVATFVKKDYIEVFNLVKTIQDEFTHNAISLYNEEDVKNGYMISKDRFGTSRKFKLLSVGCAIIELTATSTLETFNLKLGDIKKASKQTEIPLGATIIM